jgi:hypothetical protein
MQSSRTIALEFILEWVVIVGCRRFSLRGNFSGFGNFAVQYVTFDKEKRQQRQQQQQEDEDEDEDNNEDCQLQQKVNNVAEALTTKRVDDTHLSSKRDKSTRPTKRQRPLLYSDSYSELSHDKAGSYSDSYSSDELNNAKAKSDEDDKKLRPAKQK